MAAIATLTVRLSAQIAEFQKSFADTSKTLNKFTSEFEGVATKAAAVGSFFGTIAADIARSIAAGFGRAISDAVRLSAEFSNAMIGLTSVARAFGVDAEAAKNAARGLSADGLMPLKDSATGLKNLLATGFSLDQSIKLMNAFKDSAAFGRQGALSFGDAVRSATEGVKNGNSILVDNAGVTKNLSQILKEAGFSAQDLSKAGSDAAVRMALFNGILKETRAQTGDAERLTMTYTGQVSRLGAAYDQTLATIGTAITQNKSVALAIQAVGDVFVTLNTQLVQNRNAFNLVSDAVVFIAKAFSTALNIIDLVQTGFAGLQQAANRTFEAFANIGIAAFKVVEKVSELQKVLDPVNFRRHAAAAQEAKEAYTFLEGAAKGLRDASADAAARSAAWGNTLQTVRAKVDELATQLATARGQTVDLGDATGKTTGATDDNTAAGTRNIKMLSEQAQVSALLAKARRHQTAALQLETAAWVQWQGVVSNFLSKLPKGQLTGSGILGLDPSKFYDMSKDSIFGTAPRTDLLGAIGLDPSKINMGDWAKGIPDMQRQSFWQGMFGSPQFAGQQLAATIVGAFQGGGSAVAAAAGQLGSSIGSNIANFVKADGTKLFTGALGSIFSGALPVVGSLIGPLVSKIWGSLFGTSGRDTKLDMARQLFGSVEEMQKLMVDTLSAADYQRLWKQFSDVGQNNKNQAIAAVEAIKRALDDQKKKHEEVTAAAKASAEAQQAALDEITQKYKGQIDDIDRQYKTLSDSVAKEAKEEHEGITETLEREEMKRLEDKKKALEEQRDAELEAKKETFKDTFDEAEKLDEKLRNLFSKGYKIPLEFDFPHGMPPGFSAEGLSSSYTNGMTSGWEGRTPPAALTRPSGGGTAQFIADGRLLASMVVPNIPGEVKRLGLNK